MPHQIISNCTRILERNQEVVRLPRAAGYKIGNTSFDIDSFENTRQRFAEHENKLLNSLVEFVSSQYKQKWNEEEAKKYLSNFLDTEGYGTQLFLKKSSNLSNTTYLRLFILADTLTLFRGKLIVWKKRTWKKSFTE